MNPASTTTPTIADLAIIHAGQRLRQLIVVEVILIILAVAVIPHYIPQPPFPPSQDAKNAAGQCASVNNRQCQALIG